jgi:hypothetical protein
MWVPHQQAAARVLLQVLQLQMTTNLQVLQ